MIRHLLYRVYGLLAGAVILLAMVLTLARFSLSMAEDYAPLFKRALEHDLGRPVSLGKIHGEWMGWRPRFYVDDMHILSGAGTALSFKKAYVEIDVLGSLMAWKPKLRRLVVVAPEVKLHLKDGVITLGGVALSSGGGGNAWLSKPIAIGVEEGNLLWCEEASPCLSLERVNLALESDGRRFRLAGRMQALEGQWRFSLNGSIKGKPVIDALFLEGKGIYPSLTSPLFKALFPGFPVKFKRADFILWGIRGEEGWKRWTGRVAAFEVGLKGAEKTLSQLSAAFDAYRSSRGWAISLEHLALPDWPSISAVVLKAQDTLWVNADFLRIESLLAWIPPALFPEAVQGLPLPREGDVRHLRLILPLEDPQALTLEADFSRLSLDVPGKGTVRGLRGRVQGGLGGGRLALESREVTLSLPRWFRFPLEAREVSADVFWNRDGEVDVASFLWRDRGFLARGRGRFRWQGDAPFVSLLASVEKGDVTRIPLYLPARAMPEGTVKWLDRAFVEGHLRQGRALFYGRPRDFPFAQGEGTMDVRLQVEGVTLDYHEDWPALRGVAGEVRFRNQRMEIQGDRGKVFSSAIKHAEAVIPDLLARPARLEVQGEGEGPLGDALRFLHHSPLRRRFGRYLQGAQAQGASALRLKLVLPLGKHGREKPQVDGSIALRGNGVTFARQDILLSRLRGRLSFSEKGLQGKHIRGALWGQPLRLSLHTQGDEVLIQSRGSMTPEALGKHYALPFLEEMKGRTDWQGRLRFTGEEAFLNIDSPLKGLAVALPAPLGKSADETAPLTLQAHFSPRGTLYRFRCRDFNGVLAWRKGAFARGELRFGKELAGLPDEQGLRLAGNIPRLSLGAWLPHLVKASQKGKGWVNRFALTFGRLQFLGQVFAQVEVKGSKTAQGWWARVEGGDIKGYLHVNLQKAPWLALSLQELHLAPFRGGGGQALEPDALIPLHITCERLFYRGIAFGRVILKTSRMAGGWRLEDFSLSAPHLSIAGEGEWHTLGEERTTFQGKLQSDALGMWLAKLGFIREAFEAEDADVAFKLRFPGPPSGMNIRHLEGNIFLRIHRAQLKQLDPGLAKILGLLSLQALPRRLTLDFRDLFEKGLVCSEIRGKFRLQDGNAYTPGLILDGPTARIEIKGRTGLVTQDVEHEVTVVPHLGASLPLAGVLAGGVGTGVAALLAQGLLKKPLEHITEYRYRVTGSWEHPKVVPYEPLE